MCLTFKNRIQAFAHSHSKTEMSSVMACCLLSELIHHVNLRFCSLIFSLFQIGNQEGEYNVLIQGFEVNLI